MTWRGSKWMFTACFVFFACSGLAAGAEVPGTNSSALPPNEAAPIAPEVAEPTADLPVTDSQTTLWFGDAAAPKSHLLDIARGTSQEFAINADPEFSTTSDRIWYVAANGTLTSMSWEGVPTSTSPMAHTSDYPSVDVGPDFVAVTHAPRGANFMQVEVFDSIGEPQCTFNTQRGTTYVRGDEIWVTSAQKRIDPASCTSISDLPHYTGVTATFDPTGPTILRPEADGIKRFDLADGQWTKTGFVSLEDVPVTIELGAGSVWAILDTAVVQLTPEDLEIVATWPLASCPGLARLLIGPEFVWIADTCGDRISRIDPVSGAIDHWPLPGEHSPGRILSTALGPDGIWLSEWFSGAGPYLFSFDRDRFERLPTELIDLDRRPYRLTVRPGA